MTLGPQRREHIEDVICCMVEIMGDRDVSEAERDRIIGRLIDELVARLKARKT